MIRLKHNAGLALMALVLVVAAALRIQNLDRRSLWIDEVYSGHIALSPLRQLARYIRAGDAQVPLDYLGLKASLLISGTSTAGTRAWAVALGVLACALTYVAGRQWFGSRFVGVAAAFLLALAPFHLYYSQEARPYALIVVATLLNICAFQFALSRRNALSWTVYSLAVAIGLYAFYFSVILVGVELAYLLVLALKEWPMDRSLAAHALPATVVGFLAFVPWVLYATRFQIAYSANWPPLPPFTLGRWLQAMAAVLAFGPPESFQPTGGSPAALALTALLLGLAALGAAFTTRQTAYRVLVLGAISVAAVPAAWIADGRAHYFFAERQVIFAVPLVLLLASAGLWQIGRHLAAEGVVARDATRLLVTAGLLGALTLLSVPALEAVYDHPWLPKEDWRQATAFISRGIRPGDNVYSAVPEPYDGLTYYNRQLEGRVQPLAVGPFYPAGSAVDAATPVRRGDWVLLRPEAFRSDGQLAELVNKLTAAGMERFDFDGLLVVQG
jgi:mannosyltransferase